MKRFSKLKKHGGAWKCQNGLREYSGDCDGAIASTTDSKMDGLIYLLGRHQLQRIEAVYNLKVDTPTH